MNERRNCTYLNKVTLKLHNQLTRQHVFNATHNMNNKNPGNWKVAKKNSNFSPCIKCSSSRIIASIACCGRPSQL